MAEAIVTEFKGPVGSPKKIESIELVPSGGGVFDVFADGVLLFCKKSVGRHAEPGEILASLRERIG